MMCSNDSKVIKMIGPPHEFQDVYLKIKMHLLRYYLIISSLTYEFENKTYAKRCDVKPSHYTDDFINNYEV